ncbi:unnamed protein product [Lactuca saligna]|uniref:Protein kinase domain-containing protein n=1 Tax=Lactuca saligna TaxID=75948 RepID=A0AA36E0P2_LACSI|nr:unnamed protein product [Lactuca saligna]
MGDLVAVKVQRPYVLETVTIDLFIIRNLGLALRRFPRISYDVVGLLQRLMKLEEEEKNRVETSKRFRPPCLWEKDCNRELKGLDLQTGIFTLRQIKAATKNFVLSNKLGEGGFGVVYKGSLSDGSIIAVKQLSSKSKQGGTITAYLVPFSM